MNRLVIFDLDGVLFESRDMHFDALNRALEHYGHERISYKDHMERFNGLPTSTKLTMLGIADEEAARVRNEKQAHTFGWVLRSVTIDPALVMLFTYLHEAGWQIAVASNAVTATVVGALRMLGLWKLCDFVVAGDRVVNPKPDPEMYLRCMEVCEAEPATTIIVEDSPVGCEGAKKTGALVLIVSGPADVPAVVRAAVEAA